MIPKVIHYCWFGGKPLPEMAEKCIESWKKHCPDYEIRRWDESNFDVNCCEYVKQAYQAKKWAFVSDYARFKILYENGGLYFDTDVELIKSLDDLVACGAFMGVERYVNSVPEVNPGVGLAAEAGMPIYNELLQEYHARSFLKEDGSFNLITIVAYTTEILKRHGLQEGLQIQLVDGISIYPPEYFCPKDMLSGKMMITENTRSIHHFDGSWYSPEQEYALKLKRKMRNVLPGKLAARIAIVVAKCKYEGIIPAVKMLWGKAVKR